MIRLELPWPERVNATYRAVRGRGGKLGLAKSGRARGSERALRLAVAAQLPSDWRPLDKPVSVVVRWFRPRATGDVDGGLKALLDALGPPRVGGRLASANRSNVYVDDRLVTHVVLWNLLDRDRPRVEVDVMPLDATTAAPRPKR